ncbi:hypothetical protein D3C75_1045350 [compost metagenome]
MEDMAAKYTMAPHPKSFHTSVPTSTPRNKSVDVRNGMALCPASVIQRLISPEVSEKKAMPMP